MSRRYFDTDDFSDQNQPEFHVVPNSSHYDPSEADYEREPRYSRDLSTNDDDEDDLHLLKPDGSVDGEEEEEGEQAQPPPIEWHPAVLMIANIVKKVLSPVVKIVFAPQTQRAVIKSLVVIILVAWIILTSFTAYITFYQRYIPKLAHVEPIYFQYKQENLPQGQVQFRGPNPFAPLRSDQAYDVSVQLHVPTSDINFDLGNFMVNVELQTKEGTVLANSSRPAILRYQSSTQRILHVLAKALPLLVGWTEESQKISVVLIEDFIERKANPITQARITLSSSKLQVYEAHISIVADFRGLRYYMYHRRVSTAFVFIALFTVIEIIFASLAWKAFGQNLWEKLNEAFVTDELTITAAGEGDVNAERETVTEGGNETLPTNNTNSRYNTDDDDEYLTED